jgi:GNAT superfamily N-acetyltransferase
MPFATWWRGDPLPELPPLPGFAARRVASWDEAQRITGLIESRLLARHRDGNRLYAALLADRPVGYGWAARRLGAVDELRFSWDVPAGNCYLWDFVTLPEWRGRGVYPHLLQAIVGQELADGIDRFWIGYEAHNEASGRGIRKAGFRVVGDIVVARGRVAGFVSEEPGERAQAAAELLGLPIVDRT